MKTMILAASRGDKLQPITDNLPKLLVYVAGKSLIVYHIEQLTKVGIKDIVITHAYLGDKLTEALADGT